MEKAPYDFPKTLELFGGDPRAVERAGRAGLKGTGILNSDERKAWTREDWLDLRINVQWEIAANYEPAGPLYDPLAPQPSTGATRRHWRKLFFDAADVDRFAGAVAKAALAIHPDKRIVEATYRQYVAEALQHKRQPSRDEDVAFMQSQFELMPRDRIRDLRREFAPPAWQEPGAPTKSGGK